MHGEIPVVPFDIPQRNVEELIRLAFRRISVRLVTQHLRDHLLVVGEPSSIKDIGINHEFFDPRVKTHLRQAYARCDLQTWSSWR